MSRPRLLVVEDDPIISSDLREDLSPHYALTFASNVSDALQRLREEPFHMVLLDLGLPLEPGELSVHSLAGLERVLPWIRQEGRIKKAGDERPIPVLIFTARGDDPEVVIEAMGDHQANYFFRKPVEAERLLEKLEQVLLGAGGVEPATSRGIRIRIALDRSQERVVIERIPHDAALEGANYRFLEVLAAQFEQDRREFLSAQELLKELRLTSLQTVRVRVREIRRWIHSAFVEHRQVALEPGKREPHPFLETSTDKRRPGYRLNPGYVEVVPLEDLLG